MTIRKPKTYFEITTAGIKFRERWNIVEMSTKEEFEEYIKLENKIKSIELRDKNTGKYDMRSHYLRENDLAIQRYIRKCWRLRYGQNFKKDQLYKIDKIIHRYNCKISPKGHNGILSIWQVRGYNATPLRKGDIIIYSHSDELGVHYFSKIDAIASPFYYVFKPDDHQLCAIVPLEET